MVYVHRAIESKLRDYLAFFSVVGLTGPRQSGKSTLLLHALPGYQYVSFDDFKMTDFFNTDPEKFMQIYSHRVIFDEVQKVPRLFDYIKMAVDQDRDTPGKFVLTGSSQFQVIKGASESLAGRIGLLSLLPYQISELPGAINEALIYKGSYPELVNKNHALFQDWYSSYLETYLKKDVSALAQVGDKREFQRLLTLLASNTSQLLNLSHYSKDLGVDVKTIKKWISILEASYVLFLLPPYYENFGKRLVKSPKVYFYDTGLVAYLTGIETQQHYLHGPMAGSLFENYVIADIMKQETHHKTYAELFYFRTSNGQEVDLIVDRKNQREWIEIKSNATFNHHWPQPMEQLMQPGDIGKLLYPGKSLPYSVDIQVLNYWDACSASEKTG